ncbi:MAG: PrsW family glutamic-type intramembrane protease [Anaerolineales bacterium]
MILHTGGLLCGATFALVETLGSLATPAGDSWVMLVLGRFGTGILHTTTTALVGWALASAQGRGGIRRLVQVYGIAVALHGIWNIFGLLVGLVDILPASAGETSFLSLILLLGRIAPLALGFLMLVLLILLVGGSRMVAKEHTLTASEQEIGL